MPNISTKPTQLPEELGMYIDELRQRHPSIDEVWLLRHRGHGADGRTGEWDLLAFGDGEALSALRRDESLHRGDVNLLVVTDGDRFEPAWGSVLSGSLSEMRWRLEDLHSATYAAGESSTATAVRVR